MAVFTPRLSVEDYQKMTEKGWQRSGCWLFKDGGKADGHTAITNISTTQPVKVSDDAKSILERFNGYLLGGDLEQKEVERRQDDDLNLARSELQQLVEKLWAEYVSESDRAKIGDFKDMCTEEIDLAYQWYYMR